MSQLDSNLEAQMLQLQRALNRERTARREAESIAERITRDLYQHRQELAERSSQMEALFHIASLLSEPGEYPEKLPHALRELANVASVGRVTLRMPDAESRLRLVTAYPNAPVPGTPLVVLEGSDTPSTSALAAGRIIVINKVASSPSLAREVEGYQPGSIAAIPVKAGGSLLGVVTLFSDQEGHFDNARIRLLIAIVGELGALLENARLRDEIIIKQQLEQRLRIFISLASHELRTPLAIVRGFSELLLDRNVPQETHHDWLNRIHNNTLKLGNIVNQLLDISRIQQGTMSLTWEVLSLRPIIETILEDVRSMTNGHKFYLNIPSEVPVLITDPVKVSQIVTNLVENAVKYSPNGGNITVFVQHEDQQNRVIIGVKDEGLGIAEEDQESLFTPFSRISRPETQDTAGSGLGLYMVKELVDALGGDVWWESKLGKGSTFYFSLPVSQP